MSGLMIAIGLDEKDGERLYDSAILVDKTGKLLWKHRKINVILAILAFCCIGAYSLNNNVFDVYVTAVFGAVGYLFYKLDCEPAPLTMAVRKPSSISRSMQSCGTASEAAACRASSTSSTGSVSTPTAA